jgi:hypothetical protein
MVSRIVPPSDEAVALTILPPLDRLAVRLEFLGSLLMFSAALASVYALVTARDVDAGLVGCACFALSELFPRRRPT